MEIVNIESTLAEFHFHFQRKLELFESIAVANCHAGNDTNTKKNGEHFNAMDRIRT